MIQNKSSRKISKFILRDDFNIRCILFLFQTNVNRIHPFYSTLKIKRNNIPFFDLRNNVIHMEEIFFNSGKIFDKPKSSGLIKNSTLPLRITGSSSSFLGVAIIISSKLISFFLTFSSGESRKSFRIHPHKQSYRQCCFYWFSGSLSALIFLLA